VWTDAALGKIVGRVYDHASDSLSAADIPISSQTGDTPKVAGSGSGWVVAWHGVGASDADDVVTARVDASGAVSGEATVTTSAGTQDQPAIAMQDDGSYAVVWRDAGTIRMQRFSAAGAAVAGDQDNPVNDQGGTASLPAIAAGKNGPTAFYGVAWGLDSGEIHARFPAADASFLYNFTTGQSGESVANAKGVAGQRSAPSVAIGGAGYVVVSWQDDGTGPQHGIIARRLPLPSAN
jgi:hypothetical protein